MPPHPTSPWAQICGPRKLAGNWLRWSVGRLVRGGMAAGDSRVGGGMPSQQCRTRAMVATNCYFLISLPYWRMINHISVQLLRKRLVCEG